MNSEILDIAILRVLQANKTRFGLPTQGITLLVKAYAVTPTEQQCYDRLNYLVLKGLAEEVKREVHPENSCWRITTTPNGGVVYLDERGL